MRLISIALLWLPLVVLVLGWLFGQLRIFRAMVTAIVWVILADVSLFVGMANLPDMDRLFWIVMGVVMILMTIPVATFLAVTLSAPVSPAPVEVAAEAATKAAKAGYALYDGLDEEGKRYVKTAAQLGAKFGLTAFASWLRSNGHSTAAKTFRKAANFL